MTDVKQENKTDKEMVSNSEALFLFDATLCNPNGDIDQENRPRMDYATSTALVSDVRRKRDCRDYIKDVKDKDIFVNKIDLTAQDVIRNALAKHVNNNGLGDNQNYKTELERYIDKEIIEAVFEDKKKREALDLFLKYKDAKPKSKTRKPKQDTVEEQPKEEVSKKEKELDLSKADPAVCAFIRQFAIRYFADNKLFGITLAIKGIKKNITGPIQIHWGHSLHPVTLVESNRITAAFASSEESDQFSFGSRQQLYYGLFAHYLTISRTEAAKVNLVREDVALFRESLISGLSNTRTTSKLGQTPLLYLELEYKPDSNLLLGDLTRFVSVEYDDKANNGYGIRSYRDISKINYENLFSVLEGIKDKIANVHLWRHSMLESELIKGWKFPIDELEKIIEKDKCFSIEELKF